MNNMMIFSSKYSSSYQQQQQPHQLLSNNSLDSLNSSVASSNSFLAAANTIIFNSVQSNSDSPSSFQQKPQFQQYQSPQLQSNSFSNTLLKLQENNKSIADDLDFDLHFKESNAVKIESKKTNRKSSITSTSFGHVLFKDDDNLFNLDETDDDQDDDYENEEEEEEEDDDSKSIQSIPSSTRMTQPAFSTSAAGSSSSSFSLTNKINFVPNKQNSGQINTKGVSMNMPIEHAANKLELNASKNTDNNSKNSCSDSVKKLLELAQSNSPSSHMIGASFTPSSNLTDSTPQNSVTTKFNTSRTLMKLQLMKQRTEEEERKLAASATSATPLSSNHCNQPFASSLSRNSGSMVDESIFLNANTLDELNESLAKEPVVSKTPAVKPDIIPKDVLSQVFNIESKLEFPTKYHVIQMAKNLEQSNSVNIDLNRTKKSSSKTTKPKAPSKPSSRHLQNIQQRSPYTIKSSSLTNTNNSLASSGDISILPYPLAFSENNYNLNGATNNLPSSNSSQLLLSYDSQSSNLDTCSSFSQNDISEIEDIVTDELSNFNAEKSFSNRDMTTFEIENELNEMERCLNIANTLPAQNYINIASPEPVQSSRTSSSCPADIIRLKRLNGLQLTDDEIRIILKDRQKKDNHNMIERRRRFNINDRIKELGTILPKTINQVEVKQNKGSILKASVDYIKTLENELNKSKELNERFRQMTLINRQLLNRIKDLESKVNGNTVNLKQESEPSQQLISPLLNNVVQNISNQTAQNYFYLQDPNQMKNIEQRKLEVIRETDLFENTDIASLEEILNSELKDDQSILCDPNLLNLMDAFD